MFISSGGILQAFTIFSVLIMPLCSKADIFTVKRRLRDFRREKGFKADASTESGLLGASGKVVLTAIAM